MSVFVDARQFPSVCISSSQSLCQFPPVVSICGRSWIVGHCSRCFLYPRGAHCILVLYSNIRPSIISTCNLQQYFLKTRFKSSPEYNIDNSCITTAVLGVGEDVNAALRALICPATERADGAGNTLPSLALMGLITLVITNPAVVGLDGEVWARDVPCAPRLSCGGANAVATTALRPDA